MVFLPGAPPRITLLLLGTAGPGCLFPFPLGLNYYESRGLNNGRTRETKLFLGHCWSYAERLLYTQANAPLAQLKGSCNSCSCPVIKVSVQGPQSPYKRRHSLFRRGKNHILTDSHSGLHLSGWVHTTFSDTNNETGRAVNSKKFTS